MTTTDWIQFGVLFITLLSLVIQQIRSFNLRNKQEKRITAKLKILHICKDEGKSEQDIIAEYKASTPTSSIDEPEIRKSIYEMLVDETLRYRDNDTYKARQNKATTD